MSKRHKAPEGSAWRPSLLAWLPRVEVLERADGSVVGSVGPARGKWQDRDTGEIFERKVDAQISVEKHL